MKRIYIPNEEVTELKKIDLYTYLYNYEPNELVKYSKGVYTTMSHGSLHISNGLWFWWAKGVGAKSALDYLIKVWDYKFYDAAYLLKKCVENKKPVIVTMNVQAKPKELNLPFHADNNELVIKYLSEKRFIDKDIINFYINNNMLYEADYDHSCIFVGYDDKGIHKFASKRSIKDDWKMDLYGSKKQWSFRLKNNLNNILHVFESPIDLMSFQTMEKQKSNDWKYENYLSLSGAAMNNSSNNYTEVPIALNHFLKENRNINTICLHLDNDNAGKETSSTIESLLDNRYQIFDLSPKKYKDMNEILINQLKER